MAVAGISPRDRAFPVRDEQDSRRVWSADPLFAKSRSVEPRDETRASDEMEQSERRRTTLLLSRAAAIP